MPPQMFKSKQQKQWISLQNTCQWIFRDDPGHWNKKLPVILVCCDCQRGPIIFRFCAALQNKRRQWKRLGFMLQELEGMLSVRYGRMCEFFPNMGGGRCLSNPNPISPKCPKFIQFTHIHSISKAQLVHVITIYGTQGSARCRNMGWIKSEIFIYFVLKELVWC